MVTNMASGNSEDFADWPAQVTNTAKAKLTSYETYTEVMNSIPDKPQHQVISDDRLSAFMTMEAFESKWKLNETNKDS
jgi:hypothetical protein